MEKKKGKINFEQKADKNEKGNIIFKIIFLLSVAIFVSGYFYWKHLQKPISGEIRGVMAENDLTQDNIKERFEGDYFSFAHDSGYALKTHLKETEKPSLILESAYLAQNEVNSRKIAVTIEDSQERSLMEIGSLAMRRTKPDKYIEKKFQILDYSGISFSSESEGFFEKSFFIPKGSYMAIIAFTGPIIEGKDYESEIAEIMESIKWKK